MGLNKLFLLVSKVVNLLETDRLVIGHAQLSDNAFILELHQSDSWKKYIGDRGVNDLDSAGNYIKNSLIRNYQQYGYGLYKITHKEHGAPIGLCGLLHRDHLPAPDLGFALLPEYQGQGFGYEACQAVLEEAKNEHNLSQVLAITAPDNTISQNLLAKLGFKDWSQALKDDTRVFSLQL